MGTGGLRGGGTGDFITMRTGDEFNNTIRLHYFTLEGALYEHDECLS